MASPRSWSAPRATLVVGALGVVFGDIGTSPLYAMRTILSEGQRLDRTSVYGMTSLVVWTLVLVVGVLYVGLVMGSDNEGEGGILALVALLRRSVRRAGPATAVSVLGMVGAAMFLGDSVVTPAISVLSASEGLKLASPSFSAAVVPVALAILAGVFVLQRVGSGRIGTLYGPVMLVWFLVLAAGGIGSLAREPGAIAALSPHWAVLFLAHNPLTGFLTLGAVVLAVTGAEALYADLGHFGRAPITVAWLALVFPALVVAYLGEAAAVVRDPGSAGNPFYAVVPAWATIPVLVVATLATVIASEAVIAGAFTVLHQAAGLGYFPRLATQHPSEKHAGQIYVPAANWTLGAAVLLVVVAFGSSEHLAAAYGIAVSTTILITATLYLALLRTRPRPSRARTASAGVCWVVVAVLMAATLPKLPAGGWLPVGIGVVLVVVMSTWWSGQRRLSARRREEEVSAEQLAGELESDHEGPHRVAGDAVFLTRDCSVAPLALELLVRTTKVLPRRVVLLSWRIEDTPQAPAREDSVRVDTVGSPRVGLHTVDVTLGYRERLDVDHVLHVASERDEGLADLDPGAALYVVSEPIPRLSSRGEHGMARWRQRVFLVLDRLSTAHVEQLGLPPERSVIVGRELRL